MGSLQRKWDMVRKTASGTYKWRADPRADYEDESIFEPQWRADPRADYEDESVFEPLSPNEWADCYIAGYNDELAREIRSWQK